MASNYKYKNALAYEVDVVFCIDATMSMDPILNKVKDNALNFYQDFQNKMNEKGKKVDKVRGRIVAFRDYLADQNKAMMATDFFTLPDQEKDFEACIKSIIADGGGDDPEDGLEALSYAMKSDWCRGTAKKRHIIVVWSDESTHDLGFGKKSRYYPKGMPADFNELTEWWGSRENPGLMDESAKRLIMFAPDKKGWSTIRNNWNNVVHSITEDGDEGLSKVDYSSILEAIANTI